MTQTPHMISPEAATEILRTNFAPWVQDLGLVVEETGPSHATLRLPWSPRLAREGGALSGQALLSAADTATVLAVSSARSGFVPMTTVQLSSTFQRPIMDVDTMVTARLTRIGRTLAFADILMVAEGASEPAAHATSVYALLG